MEDANLDQLLEDTPEDSKVQDKKATSSSHPTSASSGHSPINSTAKADHPPVLKVDDRQRLARVRREELEKQIGET
nr:ensconsin isoform X3 [Pelodiscus sinensis]|eukprot:XP_006112790.1 ensconsin isoform X3 [Pelodiscus sinensis]